MIYIRMIYIILLDDINFIISRFLLSSVYLRENERENKRDLEVVF